MRRWWFVPVVVLLLALFLRARPAGYTTITSETTPSPDVASTSIAVLPTVEVEPTVAPSSTVGSIVVPTITIATNVFPDANITAEPATPTPTPSAVIPTPTPEPPALAPAVAPPTAPSPTAAPPNNQANQAQATLHPVRLQIPAIGLDLEPVSVGIDAQRVPIVPKHDVGWYNASALPGAGSNVVFWGHVLRWLDSPNVPAPFGRLNEAEPGTSIVVTLSNGRQYPYRITQKVQVRPEEVEYILPTDGERLTLVSCIGDNVIQEGVLTKEFRLITIAEPQ